jgi:hypothetical protein
MAVGEHRQNFLRRYPTWQKSSKTLRSRSSDVVWGDGMIKSKVWLLAAFAVCSSLAAEEKVLSAAREATAVAERPFVAFTGKVVGNRVRLRGEPALEGHIVQELRAGDCLVVVGENEGYYAVRPPKGTKAFVFRTFVLDNIVEGSHVNVRLQPDLDSPIIGQLNTGDRVEGAICPGNGKWLEIEPPAGVAFYIAKEYIEHVGDANYLARHEQRTNEVNHLLNSAYLTAQAELRKSFEEIDLAKVRSAFDRVTSEYTEFREEGERARKVLEMAQEVYLQKKVAFLEAKAQQSAESWDNKSRKLGAEIEAYQKRLDQLQALIAENTSGQPFIAVVESDGVPSVYEEYQDGKDLQLAYVREPESEMTVEVIECFPRAKQLAQPSDKMRQWVAVEESLYHLWAMNQREGSLRDFYADEELRSESVTGIVERYTRPVKNRPGDYILRIDSMPIAYLYSTKIDLEEMIGHQVTLRVTRRPNNNFAFPAFFVHSVE